LTKHACDESLNVILFLASAKTGDIGIC